MLYVVRKNRREFTWHVGTEHPRDYSNPKDPKFFNDVIEVQADGHELQRIRDTFGNLPMKHGASVICWKGDLAQFIYDHLV